MNRGKVFLVGTGPGDTGLITVKGLECIKMADTIVYDRLANEKLLSHKRPGAELVYAGKEPAGHTLSQSEINRILVEKAKQGKVVVRLKGGDPFVFGRGGEEAEVLQEAGIPFEVVPGITSAVAAPAYAGIPVTHRDYTSTFTVITGHEDPEKEKSSIDWPRLAADPGTLVFLMGVRNLPDIVKQLLKHGKDPRTPAALISRGTWPDQQVVSSVLKDIEERVKKSGLTSPAVIIIGEVVRLREKLKWRENKPLFGKKILVTRSREQAGELSKKIEELGGDVLEFPTIAIRPPADYSPLDTAIKRAGSYDWIIFTSVNGVHSFFGRMVELRVDIRQLGKAGLCAIGPKTARALEEKGLIVDLIPEKYQAEAIIEALGSKLKPGQRVLLPRADLARQIMVDSLREMKLQVDEVTAYETVMDTHDSEALKESLRNKEIQVITFTSSSTVRNFLALLDGESGELLGGTTIACIGPITAETAVVAGLKVDIIASEYTMEGLVEAIVQYFRRPDGR